MTTLTTYPDNSTGSITLVVEKTTTISKVVRTNVNGSEEVRSSSGQLPSTAGAITRTNEPVNPTFEPTTFTWS